MIQIRPSNVGSGPLFVSLGLAVKENQGETRKSTQQQRFRQTARQTETGMAWKERQRARVRRRASKP
jgi:hypothetical protein